MALAGVLATSSPAVAHGGEAPTGTNYRTLVTEVSPARPGLTVRAIEAGARLELVNSTDRPVIVLGYAGEPYLDIRPDGVYENRNSPATYLNRTLAGDVRPPQNVDPRLPPDWLRVSDGPVARWHDQRTYWLDATPPAQVRAAPDQEHRVRDWIVPVRDGDDLVEIRGILDWLPPPDPYNWWAMILLGTLPIGALGLLPAGSRAGRRASTALGALAGIGGLAAVAFAVSRAIDAGADGVLPLLVGLLTGPLWPLLAGLGALAAGGYALRRPAGEFAITLAGTCLALFAGVTQAAVLANSVVPVPWPSYLARLVIALVTVTGAGVAAAGLLRLHAARGARRTVDEPGDPDRPDTPDRPDETLTATDRPEPGRSEDGRSEDGRSEDGRSEDGRETTPPAERTGAGTAVS